MKILISLFLIQLSMIAFGQKVSVLNDYDKNDVDFFIGLEKPLETFKYLQAAQKFKCETSGVVLKKINLQRMILEVNQGPASRDASNAATFILRVYDVDSLTGAPGRDLNSQRLEVKNKRNETVSLDVSKYNITIPGTEFFIALEWLFVPNNQRMMERPISIKAPNGRSYRTVTPIYQPFIGMVNSRSKESNAWVLTIEKKWKVYTYNMPYMTDLAISVEVAH